MKYKSSENIGQRQECKAYFPLGDFVRATRSDAKTRIWQRDWLKLAGEKIRREEVGTVIVSTYLSVRANKFAKWKIGLKYA